MEGVSQHGDARPRAVWEVAVKVWRLEMERERAGRGARGAGRAARGGGRGAPPPRRQRRRVPCGDAAWSRATGKNCAFSGIGCAENRTRPLLIGGTERQRESCADVRLAFFSVSPSKGRGGRMTRSCVQSAASAVCGRAGWTQAGQRRGWAPAPASLTTGPAPGLRPGSSAESRARGPADLRGGAVWTKAFLVRRGGPRGPGGRGSGNHPVRKRTRSALAGSGASPETPAPRCSEEPEFPASVLFGLRFGSLLGGCGVGLLRVRRG